MTFLKQSLALAVLSISWGVVAAAQADEYIKPERVKAIRECNDLANKYRQRTWGKTEFTQYRVCMASRGRRE